jgi:hypothetical protein
VKTEYPAEKSIKDSRRHKRSCLEKGARGSVKMLRNKRKLIEDLTGSKRWILNAS